MTRPRLSLRSVRVRLTLWNVSVMAFVLVGLGVVFSVSMHAAVNTAVSRAMSADAQHSQRFVANGPEDRVAAFLAGHRPHFSMGPNDSGAGVGDKPHGSAPASDGPPPPPPDAGGEEPFGELRPRLFNLQGQPVHAEDPAWDPKMVQWALQGHEAFSTAGAGADAVRIFSVPLRRGGRIVAAMQFGNSQKHIFEEEARTTRTLLTLIPVVLLVAGLGGAFLTDRALRPVRQIAHETGKIEAENLSRRLPVTGDDEFADLAETFNGMLARLQAAFERQEQAFEQQRRFTADASHELRTPLTIIKANTSLALSGERTANELQKTLRTVDTAADRMNRIVQDLLLLARSDAGQLSYAFVPIPLSSVLDQALPALGADCAPVTVSLSPPSLGVIGNADALIRLFSNLLENASRYTPPDGRITVTAESLGGVVAVKVTDTGEGIAPEHLPHITERFYRVEAARSRPRGGTGLGLAICRSIVDAHGGDLVIESRPGKGTTVRVTLPLAPEPLPPAPTEALAASAG